MAERFAAMVTPKTLLEQVRSTAPFLAITAVEMPAKPGTLVDLGVGRDGWRTLLAHGAHIPAKAQPSAANLDDYFALCLACHHATVATYVPTDVDSKIRGHLWAQGGPVAVRRRAGLALAALQWSTTGISARVVTLDAEHAVSGHQGEQVSVLLGALGAAVRVNDRALAEHLSTTISAEISRQAAAFTAAAQSDPTTALKLAAILTHNAGDVDQALSYWPDHADLAGYRHAFARLAHAEPSSAEASRFDGQYGRAARLYRTLLAAEGHRNYPLRKIRALRACSDFLLPLAPWLEDWGARLGQHPEFSDGDRLELLHTLLAGQRTVRNQVGYLRALRGLASTLAGGIARWAAQLDATGQADWQQPAVAEHLCLSTSAFAAALSERARALLALD